MKCLRNILDRTNKSGFAGLVLTVMVLLPAGPVYANNDQELAKKLSNPVADLISVPFQANWDFGIGSKDAYKFTLNVQPVIPVSISKDWNLIIQAVRTGDFGSP